MRNEYLYDFYRIAFLSVKQKCTDGVTNAAKPALVIAVIEGIAAGEIKNNQIKFQDIKARYIRKLEEWQPEKTPLKYPFYHLEGGRILALEMEVCSFCQDSISLRNIPS